MTEAYRNVLAHSFGINVQWPGGSERWRVEPMPAGFKVSTAGGLQEKRIEELEDQSRRPGWLTEPTLKLDGRTYLLNAEALYWGTRRLVQVLATTQPFVSGADKLLADGELRRGLGLTGTPAVTYQASTAVSSTANASLRTTAEFWK